jgi:hypothetical protein
VWNAAVDHPRIGYPPTWNLHGQAIALLQIFFNPK